MALGTFRSTTGDPEISAAIAAEFAGSPNDWDTTGEDSIEVITEATLIDIQMNSLKSEYLLWGRNGLTRSCDGVTQNDGSDCYCKATYDNQRDWNAANKQGIACGPSVSATFKLGALPDLGIWSFNSQSKTLANDDPSWKKNATEEGEIYSPPISEIEEAFVAAGAGAPATLQLVGVSYTTKAGQAVFDGVEDAPDGGWLCLCPVHGDSNPSLKISLTDGGMVLLVCRSHDCCFADIVAAVGLTAADFRGVDPGTARTIREASSKSPANATDLAQLEALITQLADGYMNSESSTYGWDRWNIDEDDAAASSVIVAYVQTDHGARSPRNHVISYRRH